MKIKTLTIFLFGLICSVNFAQNSLSFDFAGAFHNENKFSYMSSKTMTIDSLGNHYVAGVFSGTQDLDPSVSEEIAEALNGNYGLFLAKYTTSGQLVWSKTLLASSTSFVKDIHVDGSGNIYLSGSCEDSVNLNFVVDQTTHFNGLKKEFLAKYTNQGELVWSKLLNSAYYYFRFNLNKNNEIIAACTYQTSNDIGNTGNPQIINGASNNILLMTFASNGDVIWYKSSPISSIENVQIGGIGSDAAGNIVIAGGFYGTFDADLNSGTHILMTYPGTTSAVGVYLSKYDSFGSLVWAELINGSDWVNVRSVEVNSFGEFAIMGKFSGSRDFDVTTGQKILYGNSTDNAFLAKYDASCNLIYVNRFAAYLAVNYEPTAKVALNDEGHCYMLSRKQYIVYTQNDTLNYLTSPDYYDFPDLVSLEFDSIGEIAQASIFEPVPTGSYTNFSLGYAIVEGLDGNPVILGEATRYVDLDMGPGAIYGPVSNSFFLASYSDTGSPGWCSFIGTHTNSPAWDEFTTGMVFNEQGGYFVTGSYKYPVDLDLTSGIHYTDLANENSQYAYLSCYDSTNELVWSHSFIGNLTYIGIEPLTDSQDNALIALNYNGGLSINTSLNNYQDTNSLPQNNEGLFKFDSNGGLIWGKKIFQSGDATLTDVELNVQDEIFVTGTFTGTVHFELEGVDTFIVSNGDEDIFVARYSSLGELLWLRSLGSTATDQAFQILPDGSNYFYLCGSFTGTANFSLSGGTNTAVSPNPKAIFFAKYTNSGNFGFIRTLSSTGIPFVNDFKKDAFGNLLLAGKFNGTLDCDPSSGIYNLTASGYKSFIAKYISSGNFTWAKSFGVEIRSFIIDSSNNILIGGAYSGEVQFLDNPFLSRTSKGGSDIFLAYLSAGGQVNNVFSFGSQVYEDLTHVTYRNGLVGMTGKINILEVDFDPSSSENILRNSNGYDGFIAKYHLCTAPSVSILWNFITMKASVDGVDYQWVDGSTNEAIPGEIQQYFTPTEDGSYYVVISTPAGCSSSSQTVDIVNLGLEEIQKGQITIYPNPTSSWISIKIENPSENYWVSVYSLSGTTVLAQNLSENSNYQLDTSAWPQGVYLIRLDSENESQVFKIIKN